MLINEKQGVVLMTKYISTRDQTVSYQSSQAVLQGLSPDGGLFIQESFKDKGFTLESTLKMTYQEIGEKIINLFFPELPKELVKKQVELAYNKRFTDERIAPVKQVADVFFLELFHGPTSAFKDMALSLLPGLMELSSKYQDKKEKLLILTATSGDTGKAALESFKNNDLVDIVVFYPEDGVSEVQKLQMITQEGENVTVCAVKGNFDDAQTAVKTLFQDEEMISYLKDYQRAFSSANSVNIGRLIPQIIYYFDAYKQLVLSGEINLGEKIDVTVPTGNFGNILAGFYAKELGLPVHKFICASNANNVLADFLKTGVYDIRREFKKTSSPSMDILISSNLERLLFLLSGGDSIYVASLMSDLKSTGIFRVSPELLERMQDNFSYGYATDSDVALAIKKVYEESGYVMDPHTAVAYSVMSSQKDSSYKQLILSTASPYKFSSYIASDILGNTAFDTELPEMALINLIEKTTKQAAPSNIKELKDKEVLHQDTIELSEMKEYIKKKVSKMS